MKIMKSKKKRYFPLEERNNFKKLISKKGNFSNVTLTFENYDGSKLQTDTNDSFFQNEQGSQLPLNKVMENINALKHDYRAKNVTIN